jgi:hypothetical protein
VPTSNVYEDYYRVKLILYYSFTTTSDLLIISSIKFPTFSNAFDVYRYSHSYKEDFYTNLIELTKETTNSNTNTKDKAPKEVKEPLGSFKAFTRRRP